MSQLKEYMINETAEFSTLENNPMIYTLIIPKLLNGDLETVKEDEIIKNAVDITEKFIKTLSKDTINLLKNSSKPYAVMDLFKLSKNIKSTFDYYLQEFRSIICNNETNFIKCMDLDNKITELYNSPEYQLYRNTL